MIALYDLCWHFGFPDPAALLDRMSEPQLRRWLIYAGRIRDEERRADARAAAIIAAIYETRRDRKQRARAYTARDFIPKYPDEREERPVVINRPTGASVPVSVATVPRASPSPVRAPMRPVLSADESASRLVEQFRKIGARRHGRRDAGSQNDA